MNQKTASRLFLLLAALLLSACQVLPSPAAASSPTAYLTALVPTPTALPAAAAASPAPLAAGSDVPARPTLLANLAEPVSLNDALPPGLTVRLFKMNQPVIAEEVGYTEIWSALKEQSGWVQKGEKARSDGAHLLMDQNGMQTQHLSVAGDDLYAALEPQSNNPNLIARVYRNQKPIYELTSDVMHVRPLLYGLWAYGDHWALEVLESIAIDGQAVNATFGYQKSYEFHLLAGKPLYLFERSGQLGVNFNGQEVLLPGTKAPHYNCCSGTLVNPRLGASTLVFFTVSDQQWFYVEIEADAVTSRS